MKNKTCGLLLLLLLLSNSLIAQTSNISGSITDESGVPLLGVNILVENTTKGTQSDFDGHYTIEASVGETLVFSYIGMQSIKKIIGNNSNINVVMQQDANQLNEVVITALGIKKTRSSLTYAAQDMKSEEISRVKQTNPLNSLSGKIAGLNIQRNSSGAGGSVKVVLRGNNSFGGNQPLYVLDGVPLLNPTASQPTELLGAGKNSGNRDGGDALSLINPDDVESMTILKGASASALYGSAGLNGVILITTKKGHSGNFRANYSSSLTVDDVAYNLDFNDGTKKEVDDFFRTGHTAINSITLSGGSEKTQTFFAYSNTFSSGVLPTNNLKQHTISLRETTQFFDDVLTVNGSIMLSSQKVHNRPVAGGLYYNPLVGVYSYADDKPLSHWKTFEALDTERNIQAQRWWRTPSDVEENPYWFLHRTPTDDSNEKLLTNLSLSFKITDWLSLQTRGTYDRSKINYERKVYATTQATLAPENGKYTIDDQDITQLYGDLIANINHRFDNDISVTANLGASTRSNAGKYFSADSGIQGGLQFANIFSIQNFVASPGVSLAQNVSNKKVNSLFASTTLGYDDKLFLDLTARNDWSSTLPASNNSFFYPSIGATGILSKMIDFGKIVSFAKLRASYAEVGNDFPFNAIQPDEKILFGKGLSPTAALAAYPGSVPKPERQRSFEIGTEWRFFDNRLGLDIGYYHTTTKNQYFPFPTSAAATGGLSSAYLNAGNILNQGVEVSVYGKVIDNDHLKWQTNLNFAANENKIKAIFEGELVPGLIEPQFFTVSARGVNTFGSYLTEGARFGDIYARTVKKDAQNHPIVTDNGATILEDTDNLIDGLTRVGNANPNFTLGWNNTFDYKNFNLSFLIDGKFGGETVSLTESVVESVSNNTIRKTENANVNVVDPQGNAFTMTAQEYYGKVGGRNSFSGEYVYSATNVRLAELALGYKLDLKESNFFTDVKLSLIGNNLFFFYKDTPYDPNVTLSTGNALQGIDAFGMPSTRSLGLSLQLTF